MSNAAATVDGTFIRRRVGGVDALLIPKPGSGLIAAQVYIKRGSVDEAEGEIGLASFTASMLKRGTAARSSAEVAFELESLGAMSGHGSGSDASRSSLRSAAPDFPKALPIFFDSLRNPAFDSDELEIERQSVLAYLKRLEDDKFDLTYRRYMKEIFAGHGYGHPSEGEVEDVEAVTPDRCRSWHAKTYRPENMMLGVAGDFDPDELCGWFESHLKDWPAAGEATARCEEKTAPPGDPKEIEIEKEFEQGFVVMGFRTPGILHPDHPALRLASAALGEGFAGRLFTHLRDERSLAYAVGSALSAQRLGGHMVLYIGTQPERLDEAREGLVSEAEAMRGEPLSDADLQRACRYVAGKYLMAHQSLASRAGYRVQWEDSGAGAEYDDRYVDDLKNVTADQVLDVVRRWWVDPTITVLRPTKQT